MMTPYETDIRRVIKWLHNEAVYLPHYIENKAAWYDEHDEKFWQDWFKNVFNIRTANAFGLIVWCVILGVPTSLFDVKPQGRPFAFGKDRQNFVGSTETPGTKGLGGNFINTNDTIRDADEIRKMLRLRYANMINGGNLQFINKMLNLIFNEGKPWNVSGLEYMYVADSTCSGFDETIDYFLNDWRGSTKINLGVESKNYFTNHGSNIYTVPYGSSQLTSIPREQTPNKSWVGRKFTSTIDSSEMRLIITGEGISPPTHLRTMVYGACVRATHASRFMSVQVYEDSKPFSSSNRFREDMNSLSKDIVNLDATAPVREGLTVKPLNDGWVWIEVAARFTNTGRAGALVLTPCDENGNPTDTKIGDYIDIWSPCWRDPQDNMAYFLSSLSTGTLANAGSWEKNEGVLYHLVGGQPTQRTAFLNSEVSIRSYGVKGHDRTERVGDLLSKPGLPTDMRSDFLAKDPTIKGKVPAEKTFDYRIGANTEISSRFLAILRERKNDIMFQHAGIPYTVTRES